MRLHQPYCVYEGQFSADICDRIIELGENVPPMHGAVSNDPENNLRDSVVAWIRQNEEHAWLYELISGFVRETNELYWNWQLSGPEPMQYTKYGPEQFYTWHRDQKREPYDAESRWPGQIRKISISIHLSDSDAYEGGEFAIENSQTSVDSLETRQKVLTEARTRGSAIVFPSHLYHRVQPVTSGKRQSLVAWFLGPPFV